MLRTKSFAPAKRDRTGRPTRITTFGRVVRYPLNIKKKHKAKYDEVVNIKIIQPNVIVDWKALEDISFDCEFE